MAHTVDVPIGDGSGLFYRASVWSFTLTRRTTAPPGLRFQTLAIEGESVAFNLFGIISPDSPTFITRYLESVRVHPRAHNAIVGLICNLNYNNGAERLKQITAYVDIEACYVESEVVVGLSAEDHGLRPTKASRDRAMEALEKVTVGLDETGVMSCAVCLDEFLNGSEAMKMPCSHVFHGGCIGGWLEKRVTFPLCRFELSSV